MTESVTRLLQDLREGDAQAFPELLAAVQQELRGLAARHLAGERLGHTLQPTALVHEAYLKLVEQRAQSWESKSHFLAIASTAMRRVLLEHARARLAGKRDGGKRVTLFEVASAAEETPAALVALDGALEELARVDPEGARIVELRWFGGLSSEDAAQVLGVSTATVERGWRAARAWLRERLSRPADR